jgi:hypothetical protein
MIVARTVFQAKYGQGDALVALLKEGNEILARHRMGDQRILTDRSGPFFTVVMETEVESFAAWEESQKAFGDPDFGPWFERMMGLVESGSREFYGVEE